MVAEILGYNRDKGRDTALGAEHATTSRWRLARKTAGHELAEARRK